MSMSTTITAGTIQLITIRATRHNPVNVSSQRTSGDQQRHRLSRAGNRRINRALHIMAVVQLRHDTDGRRYFDRRVTQGKTKMEAMRALKRRLSDVVYRQLIADQKRLRAVDA